MDIFDINIIKKEFYCRTCLTEILNDSNMQSLYDISIKQILKECTSICINENDRYSKYICESCKNLLLQFYSFKFKCLEIEEFLKKINDASNDIISGENIVYNNFLSKIDQENDLENLNEEHFDSVLSDTKSNSLEDEKQSYSKVLIKKSLYFKHNCTETSENILNENKLKKSKKEIVNRQDKSEPKKTELYQCEKCSKQFKLASNLSKHLKRHEESSEQLNEEVKNENEIVEIKEEVNDDILNNINDTGLKDENDENDLKSRKCRKKSPSNDKLLKKSKKLYACKYCLNKTFTKRKYLDQHLLRHQRFTCPQTDSCDKKFTRLSELLQHINDIHYDLEPKVNCNQCEKSFFVSKELEHHYKNEHLSGVCDICNQVVRQLKRHKRLAHADLKTYSCDICERKFKIKRNLDLHNLEFHVDGIDPRVVCNHCGLKFYNVDAHIQSKHMNNTAAVKQFKCRYCKIKFTNLSDLIMHSKKEHVNEKLENLNNYACKICDKKYMRIQGLRLHIKYVHNNDFKPIECKVCGHKSKTLEHSRLHMRVHTDERPFPCDLCARKFKNRSTLRDHRRTHTGERPHLCIVCNKSFTQRSALTTHLRMHNK